MFFPLLLLIYHVSEFERTFCSAMESNFFFLTISGLVTMQAQKEAPPDMQCKDKFLLQSVIVSPRTTAKDITPEMVRLLK